MKKIRQLPKEVLCSYLKTMNSIIHTVQDGLYWCSVLTFRKQIKLFTAIIFRVYCEVQTYLYEEFKF